MLNGNSYVGKTTRSLKRRFYEHTLGQNKEKMPIVRAIQKYGKENFKIEVLFETNDLIELNLMEISLIGSLKPHYNVAPGGEGGALFLGKKHTESTKNLLREKKIGTKDTDETKQKKRLSKIGKKQSAETIKKKMESQAKTYIFVGPDNTELVIKNLNDYCRSNNLSASAMRGVYYGKRNIHKGYRRQF